MLLLSALSVLLFCGQLMLADTVVISEIVAANDQGIEDVDGDNSDWIEIYNCSDQAVDLRGWFLSDDAGELDKWRFPEILLQPRAHLLVFASDKDRRNPRGELHTNFKLSAGGEYLALVRPDGTIAADFAPAFPALPSDVSYGLISAGEREESSVLVEGAPLRIAVPESESDFINGFAGWQQPGYDDSAWLSAHTGVGFEKGSGYEGYLSDDGDLLALFDSERTSYFMRIPFKLDDGIPAELKLRLR
jgi:hypothetical protein